MARPHILEYFRWLKSLDALSVFDSLEKGEGVKEAYNAYKRRFSPFRMAVAAARGLLKASQSMREDALKAVNINIARLTLRFENPAVYEVLRQFDPKEEFLKRCVEEAKEILGLTATEEAE